MNSFKKDYDQKDLINAFTDLMDSKSINEIVSETGLGEERAREIYKLYLALLNDSACGT